MCLSPMTRGWFKHCPAWTDDRDLSTALTAASLRSNMLDSMNEDYVRTAGKGLSERQVMTATCCALADPDHHPVRARLRGDDRRHRDHHRKKSSPTKASATTRRIDRETRTAPILASTLYGAFFVVFINALVDIAYATSTRGSGSGHRLVSPAPLLEVKRPAVGFATEGAWSGRDKVSSRSARRGLAIAASRARASVTAQTIMGLTQVEKLADRGLGQARRQDLIEAPDGRPAGLPRRPHREVFQDPMTSSTRLPGSAARSAEAMRATRTSPSGRRGRGRRAASKRSDPRRRTAGRRTRTSSPAGCGSGR